MFVQKVVSFKYWKQSEKNLILKWITKLLNKKKKLNEIKLKKNLIYNIEK